MFNQEISLVTYREQMFWKIGENLSGGWRESTYCYLPCKALPPIATCIIFSLPKYSYQGFLEELWTPLCLHIRAELNYDLFDFHMTWFWDFGQSLHLLESQFLNLIKYEVWTIYCYDHSCSKMPFSPNLILISPSEPTDCGRIDNDKSQLGHISEVSPEGGTPL